MLRHPTPTNLRYAFWRQVVKNVKRGVTKMRSMSPQIPFVATPKQIRASGHGERHPPNERLNQTPICSTSYTRCCSLLNALILPLMLVATTPWSNNRQIWACTTYPPTYKNIKCSLSWILSNFKSNMGSRLSYDIQYQNHNPQGPNPKRYCGIKLLCYACLWCLYLYLLNRDICHLHVPLILLVL